MVKINRKETKKNKEKRCLSKIEGSLELNKEEL